MNGTVNPLLYAFIAKICDIVGAPAPKRIDMDCQLNASASFYRGFRGMLGNDLVLTIGLPLVANLSTRELAGVIAHEFGHFTQGAGMRLCYVIRSINFWFARVACQRDAWDEALENWSSDVRDGRVAILVWSVQIAVWFSRLILKLLMLIGHIVAGFMLRQMEYDADAWQIKVVGSETFEATHRKLATLEAALAGTYQQIRLRWKKDHHLPDNLSELLRQTHESLPPAVLQNIDDTLGFHRTSLFDSHPSPADRIRRGRMSGEAGIFHNVRPASSLFASFEHPARFVTLLHYTDNLGIPVTSQRLLHVESTQPKAARGYAAAANSPADDYANHLETMDALAVFDRVVAVTKSAGETPALSQALDAQKKIVNSFVAGSPAETKTVTIRPALQLARRQSHPASNEIESLRQNSFRWLVDYRKMVDQLVEIAGAAGGTSG